MPNFKKIQYLFSALTLAVGSLLAPASWAQATASNLASQTIKLIVGYAPGGPVDTSARQFAPHLARELGATVIVENRPGAAGAIGGDAVAKSAPAGINNTLLLFLRRQPHGDHLAAFAQKHAV